MAHATVTRMTETETLVTFCEGLKQAASSARELAAETEDSGWLQIANILDGMRENGYKLARMKAMTRREQLTALSLKAGTTLNGVNMNPLKMK